jgi:hypothetical protein
MKCPSQNYVYNILQWIAQLGLIYDIAFKYNHVSVERILLHYWDR